MTRPFVLLAGTFLLLVHVPATADDAPSAPATLEAPAEDPFAWLEGDWARETRRGLAVESWVRVSAATLEGVATVTSGEETRVSEYLRLERFGDEVFYTAKPAENAFPTPFRLIETGATEEGYDRFVFENPDHDFPQRIIYVREGEDGLLARIEGVMEGEVRGIDFRFRRKL